MNDIFKDYQEKGVAIIPNVFSEEECVELKAQAYSVEDSEIIESGYPHVRANRHTIRNRSSFFQHLPMNT